MPHSSMRWASFSKPAWSTSWSISACVRRRMTQAEQGIEELRQKVDSLVIIPNERLKYATDQKITFANAFGIADDVVRQL